MDKHSTRSTIIMRFAAIITATASLSAGAVIVGNAQAAEPTSQTDVSVSQNDTELQ